MNEEWIGTTLGEIAHWGAGGTPKAGSPKFYEGGTIPWAVIADVQDAILLGTEKSITEEGLKVIGHQAPAGAVLVTMYGTIGRVAITSEPTATNQAIAWGIPVVELVSSEFLFHWLRNYQPVLDGQARGATQRNINRAIIKSTPISLPPLAVQRRIVDLMTHLDAHIANLQAERAAVDRLMVSTAEGLGHCSPDTSVPLGSVAHMYQPKTLAKADLTALGAHPVFGANGLIGYHDEFNHSESQVAVTCRGATCGRVNWTPPLCWITGNAMVVSPLDESTLDQRYLFWALQFITNISSSISGSAQPQITRTSLAPVRIPLPELSEQKAFAQTLDSIAGQVDALGLEIDQANDLRSTLLSVLLSGTLSLPTEYDTILEQVA